MQLQFYFRIMEATLSLPVSIPLYPSRSLSLRLTISLLPSLSHSHTHAVGDRAQETQRFFDSAILCCALALLLPIPLSLYLSLTLSLWHSANFVTVLSLGPLPLVVCVKLILSGVCGALEVGVDVNVAVAASSSCNAAAHGQ